MTAGRPVVLEATDKARTKGSRDAFLSGFLEPLHALARAGNGTTSDQAAISATRFTAVTHDSTADGHSGVVVLEPPACSAGVSYGSEDQLHTYAKMRFFDVCPTYTKYKAEKPWMRKITAYVVNASRPESRESAFLRQLLSEDSLKGFAGMSASSFKKAVKKIQRMRMTGRAGQCSSHACKDCVRAGHLAQS
jgi:hypothetical protein